MAKFSLRRSDSQAQASLVLSLISLLPLAAMVVFMAQFLKRGLNVQEVVFYYGPRGRAVTLICALSTMMLSAAGFGLGLSSAGQRRNDKQRLSWIGFFTGALVLAITFVLVFCLMKRGEMILQ